MGVVEVIVAVSAHEGQHSSAHPVSALADCVGVVEVSAHEEQHSPANPNAAKVIKTNPIAPTETGNQLPCFLSPGTKAAMAIKKQMLSLIHI